MAHVPVLLHEVISGLDLKAGETVVDGTLGGGGHSLAICSALGAKGHLIGLDQDEQALANARAKLNSCPTKLDLIHGNFRQMQELLATVGVKEVEAVLLDLGLSSDQLAESGRGFSFQHDEPLLMTLSASPAATALTAKEVVNTWSEETLTDIFKGFGEEPFAPRIAHAITLARAESEIATTGQLVEVIRRAVPVWYTKRRRHFATQTFQALRMAVNDELEALKAGLAAAWQLLKPEGRLAVISFHSLEARLVKNFFREKVGASEGKLVAKKAIKPAREEGLANPRSRSAQLRIIKKL